MPTQRLVIDADDKKRFCFLVRDGALTIGAGPANADLVLGTLRIVRIHCEVDIEVGAVVVGNDPTSASGPVRGREIRLGEELHVGPAHVRLVMAAGAAGPPTPAPPPRAAGPLTPAPLPRADSGELGGGRRNDAPPIRSQANPSAAPANLVKRLVVIDGADVGRMYPLGEAGLITIGNSQKHADVVLHDLYVSRVHCELKVEGDRVLVTHHEGRTPTLINGKEIAEQELQLGDVLRVGNSHLRFELGVVEPPAASDSRDDSETIAVKSTTPTPEEAGPAADDAETEDAPDPLMELEGQVLGNYHFGAVLGRGLSSLVFQARHRQTNQTAVVKVLARDFPQNDAELQTFIKALKVVAPLRHPHLVTLYAAGKAGPHCWIAREYVLGESLAALIARLQEEGKLNWKRACRVAIHLGQVLDFLHRHQIVPGPLTPANVLIEQDTRATKLADVMLDQALRGSRLEEIILEKRQSAELPYCAPEQTEPGATTDHRAALYGLGALLYALLTGQPPFIGKTPEQIIARVCNAKVAKPSKIIRDIPPPFESAVLKLLAKCPEDRFQTAADMLGVVEPIANIHEIKL